MTLKSKIANSPVIGSWINSGSPVIAELMSASGFDYLVLDAEHSAIDVAQTQVLIQAINSGNPECFPMVRLPGNSYSETKRYLDAGAMGIIVPLINSAEEAKEVVRSAKYPPEGERGVGFGRSHGYGFKFDEYMKMANKNTFICIQIEHITAVNNLDQILAVKGIDAAFIGPYDLAASMAITAQFEHPDYIHALEKIISGCRKYNISPGIHVVQPDSEIVVEKIKHGFKMIAFSLDITMIGTACRKGLIEIKKGFKDAS
jgi:2-dehydro-3-deoxyglucarate aldolase